MNKKLYKVVGVVVIIAIALAVFYLYNKSNQPKLSITSMYGKVVSAAASNVAITGYLDSKDYTKSVTIDFAVGPNTKLVKKTLILLPSGQHYTPKTKTGDGNVSDLKPNVSITQVKAKQNLVDISKADALEIDYTTFEYGQ